MTVSVQTPLISYTTNGVTTAFSWNFLISSTDDFLLTIDDVETTSGYTLTGIGNVSGGTATFSVAPATGKELVIRRNISLARDTDYQTAGEFREEVVDADFDRLWMALQQISTAVAEGVIVLDGVASNVSITDGGGYYAGANVEAALQELGALLAAYYITSSNKLGVGANPASYGRMAVAAPSGLGGVVAVSNALSGGGGSQLSGWYNTTRTHWVDFHLSVSTPGVEYSEMNFGTIQQGVAASRFSISHASTTNTTFKFAEEIGAASETSLSISLNGGGGVTVAAKLSDGDADLTISAEDTLTLSTGTGKTVVQDAAGDVTVTASGLGVTISPTGGIDIDNSAATFKIGGDTIIKERYTGWTILTGTADNSTSWATGTITTAQLAQRVKAIEELLKNHHGLIGA